MKIKDQMTKVVPILSIILLTGFSIFSLIGIGLDISTVIASIAILLIFIAVTIYYSYMNNQESINSIKMQLMFWLFIMIGYVPSLFVGPSIPWLMPALLTVALITSLIHVRLGFVVNFVMLTLILVSSRIDLDIYLMFLIGGSFMCLTIPKAKNRQQILYVAISNAVFLMLINVVTYLLWHDDFADFAYISLVYAGLNGLFVVIVAVGTEPMWELIFGITSTTRLVELSNSNEELLQKLMMEAPGTYHHSMLVANLAEKAAIEVGCNYHLARTAALYHDIGKINRPEYFTENQTGKNIHDELSPDASAAYIISHVAEGLEMAKRYKLPENIRAIINEHHGDTLVSYFYRKAQDHSDGFEVDASLYKYKGKKPQSKESAIVMLADCLEAAIKALNEGDKDLEVINLKIDQVINTVIAKDQLDECPLSFKEIPAIKKGFLSVYKGMFHERVQYDRM